MALSRDTMLKRCSAMELELRPDGSVQLKIGGRSHAGDIHTLALLDAFSTARSFADGLEWIKPRLKGNRAWMEASRHLRYLHGIGALEEPGVSPVELPSHPGRFDAFPVHLRMLFDEARTLAFQQAIRKAVRPSDIVVDIGTGSGVLAAMAAMAGARHVYAVERSNIAGVARALFKANGLSDRITLIEGRSTEIELPEKADVMVSEIIGNDPLQEGVLPTTHDAIRRLLKPGARLIPGRLRICALPLSVPERVIERHLPLRKSIEHFRHLYGIDFSPLLTAGSQQAHTLLHSSHKARDWPHLSAPIIVADIDLGNPPLELAPSRHKMAIVRDGVLNGILIYFELDLGTEELFSIHPTLATPGNHWASKVWVPGEPVAVRRGDALELEYHCNGSEGSSFKFINP